MVHFNLHIQQIIVISISLLLVFFLFWEKVKPAVSFFFAVLLFMVLGIISTKDFLSVLSNEAVLDIFLLIFITSGIRQHFNLIGWLDSLFGRANTLRTFTLKLTSAVVSLSAFLNNTPIVALFMPYVYQWSKRNGISPSKLMIPLSYSAIIGGMITVIGTSTNLVLNGLIITKNVTPLGVMDYLVPGLLVSVVGIIFLCLFSDKLLPDRTKALNSKLIKEREYLIETKVSPNSSLAGRSVLNANLRNLDGVYLFEIIRQGQIITPVEPEQVINANDSLFFAGDTRKFFEQFRNEDLILPNEKINLDKVGNMLETVIPINSDLVGKTLKELNFRRNYDAAVIAIHRNGEKLRGKIGELVLSAGDLLVISAGNGFQDKLLSNQNLYLVSVIPSPIGVKPIVRSGFFLLLGLLVALMVLNVITLFFTLLIVISYMMFFGLLNIEIMKREFDMSLFIILISSLIFSTAIINSGAAQLVAKEFISIFNGWGNVGILIGLYFLTLLLTSFITHIAAVSIVFPIAYGVSLALPELSSTAIFVAIAFAASASFHSPFSYQTNLMVYGPGGYKFKDYLKIGVPFTSIYSIIVLIYLIVKYHV